MISLISFFFFGFSSLSSSSHSTFNFLFSTSFFYFWIGCGDSSSSSSCRSSFAFFTILVLNFAAPISACFALPKFAGSSALNTIAVVLMTFFGLFYPNGSTLSSNWSLKAFVYSKCFWSKCSSLIYLMPSCSYLYSSDGSIALKLIGLAIGFAFSVGF